MISINVSISWGVSKVYLLIQDERPGKSSQGKFQKIPRKVLKISPQNVPTKKSWKKVGEKVKKMFQRSPEITINKVLIKDSCAKKHRGTNDALFR